MKWCYQYYAFWPDGVTVTVHNTLREAFQHATIVEICRERC